MEAQAERLLGLACSELMAEAVVNPLKFLGFPARAISFLFLDRGDGRINRSAIRRLLGRDLPTGVGNLVELELGVLIGTGPVLDELSGWAGSGCGEWVAAVRALGAAPDEAIDFRENLRMGDILIGVETSCEVDREVASKIFERAGVRTIQRREACAGEAPASAVVCLAAAG